MCSHPRILLCVSGLIAIYESQGIKQELHLASLKIVSFLFRVPRYFYTVKRASGLASGGSGVRPTNSGGAGTGLQKNTISVLL